ncbi:MAG TPA: DUF4382 domain-containing protein [Leptospiraceae bacterium]|nr:DUF4382 domain-containing protein [Leptospiraceae bacterium]
MNPFPKRKNHSILLFISLCISLLSNSCSKVNDASPIPTNSFTGSMVISPPSDVTILKNDELLGDKNPKATQAFTVNGIVGLQSVWIEEEADIDSNIYVVSDCIGWFPKHEKGRKFADEVCLKKKSELTIGERVHGAKDRTFKADSITVSHRANIEGTLEGNSIDVSKHATASNQKKPLGELPGFANFLKGTPGTVDVKITANSINPLPPSNYKDLLVKKGKTLELQGGFYHFQNIKLDENSILTCKTTCIVLVQDKFDSDEKSIVMTASQDPNDFCFYIAGKNGNGRGEDRVSAKPKAVQIGDKNQIVASFYVPFGTLEFKERTTAQGIFIGREVKVGEKTKISDKTISIPFGDLEFAEVILDLREVQFQKEGGGSINIIPSVKEHDLLKYLDGNKIEKIIDYAVLPSGNYTGILLQLGNNTRIKTKTGNTIPIKLVSSISQNSLLLSGNFTLRGGHISELKVKTGADNAVVGGNDQAFIVKPDIRIESVKSFTTEQENKIVLAAGAEMLPMLEESSIVIQGTVTQTNPAWGYDVYGNQQIYTYMTIKVSDNLKGEVVDPNNFPFRIIGGTVGEVTLVASHTPTFKNGDSFILFLKYYGNVIGISRAEIAKISL